MVCRCFPLLTISGTSTAAIFRYVVKAVFYHEHLIFASFQLNDYFILESYFPSLFIINFHHYFLLHSLNTYCVVPLSLLSICIPPCVPCMAGQVVAGVGVVAGVVVVIRDGRADGQGRVSA